MLQPLLALGTESAITAVKGHQVRLQEMAPDSPKGTNVDGYHIFTTILAVAASALQQAERVAELKVYFIFHQTSRETVNGIRWALQLLAGDVLDAMALQAGKNLIIPEVVLLSCESATDKVAGAPVPAPLRSWVDQASNMRTEALKAFTIGQTPPAVITFSTGNPATGAVSLNPFAAEFRALRGHFNPDGTWDYNRDAKGRPDHTQLLSGGTIYTDNGQAGGSTTRTLAPGASENLMPFTLP